MLLTAALLSAYVVTPAFANDAHHPTLSSPPTGSVEPTAAPAPPSAVPTATVIRVAGSSDRYASAIAMSKQSFAAGSVKHAILVSGTSYADGLAASSLAGAYKSPVLLTSSKRTPAGLVAEFRRLGTTRVHVIGSTKAISADVVTALKKAGLRVQRISGANTYATAAAVARQTVLVRGPGHSRQVFVVNVNDLGNAVSAAGYAYSTGIPILYVEAGSVPPETARALKNLRVAGAVAVGGIGNIYASTFKNLATRTSQDDTRVVGADRFEVAHDLAEFAIDAGWSTSDHVTILNGVTAYTDGVIGAAITGSSKGITLLATADTLPYYTDHFVAYHASRTQIRMVAIVGGAGSIDDSVMTDLVESIAGGEMDMTLMMPMDPTVPMPMMPMMSHATTMPMDPAMST